MTALICKSICHCLTTYQIDRVAIVVNSPVKKKNIIKSGMLYKCNFMFEQTINVVCLFLKDHLNIGQQLSNRKINVVIALTPLHLDIKVAFHLDKYY